MKTQPGFRYDEASHQWLPEPADSPDPKPEQQPEPAPAPTEKD